MKKKIRKPMLHPGMRIRTAAALVLLLAAGLTCLTGCGAGGKSGSATYFDSASGGAYVSEAMAETAAAAMDAGGSLNSFSNRSAMAVDGAMAEDMEVSGETGSGALTSETSIQPISGNRKLIRTVSLDVETTEFDTLIADVSKNISDLGGYLESSDISGTSISSSYSNSRYAFLTARVPSEKLDIFLTQVDKQGNVTNRSENTSDVTLQYSDIESRKKSLTIEQERLWELLEKADSVDSVIALESRLSEIRYQLESFESQLRTYDNQVDYSTVHLSISEVKVFTPTEPDSILTRIQRGFQRNLTGVANGLVDFFVWFVSSLPLLILLALIAFLAYLLIRALVARNRRKHAESGKPAKPKKRKFFQKAPKDPAGTSGSPDAPQSSEAPAASQIFEAPATPQLSEAPDAPQSSETPAAAPPLKQQDSRQAAHRQCDDSSPEQQQQ